MRLDRLPELTQQKGRVISRAQANPCGALSVSGDGPGSRLFHSLPLGPRRKRIRRQIRYQRCSWRAAGFLQRDRRLPSTRAALSHLQPKEHQMAKSARKTAKAKKPAKVAKKAVRKQAISKGRAK